ncbi:replication initiator [Hamadaea sp. NPDC051192]|uniref:replication initiator n=1 Tax=Hamadaea sp. NPDC051192 TaxID=3154940 RepID=UPI00341442FB
MPTATDTIPGQLELAFPDPAALLLGLDGAPGIDPDELRQRVDQPGFVRWLDHATRARGCAQPIRLAGEVITLDAATNAVVDRFSTDQVPDRLLYKACGTRRATLCPACAEVYKWDTYQLLRAGLAGGKGVPDTVASHPALFVTLTAPSFGPVHTMRGKNIPCRPRRDKPICPHGRPLSCSALHRDDDPRLGQPLCLDCYDHDQHVIWNHLVGKLWDRTMVRVRRSLPGGIKLRYAKVAEYQRRGVVHLHILIRVDGFDPDQPDSILPPPQWADRHGNSAPIFGANDLAALLQEAIREVVVVTDPHPDRPQGWLIAWGQQADLRVIRSGLPGSELTDTAVVGYLAKYATKSTEATGHLSTRITGRSLRMYTDPSTHTGRLIAACWRLGRRTDELCEEPPFPKLRRWAHMLGFGGHFSTRSRAYSTTLRALREARRPPTPGTRRLTAEDFDALDLADLADDETTLAINRWEFLGIGWHNTTDAGLAQLAADLARERRPLSSCAHVD